MRFRYFPAKSPHDDRQHSPLCPSSNESSKLFLQLTASHLKRKSPCCRIFKMMGLINDQLTKRRQDSSSVIPCITAKSHVCQQESMINHEDMCSCSLSACTVEKTTVEKSAARSCTLVCFRTHLLPNSPHRLKGEITQATGRTLFRPASQRLKYLVIVRGKEFRILSHSFQLPLTQVVAASLNKRGIQCGARKALE